MRRLSTIVIAALAGTGACNALTGAGDLVVDKTTGANDAAVDHASPPVPPETPPGTPPPPPPLPLPFDAGIDAAGCTPLAPPSKLLGDAITQPAGLTPFVALTPAQELKAGGVLTTKAVAFDDFFLSMQFSLEYVTQPAAGLAFAAFDGDVSLLDCKTGPNICAFGKISGFGVVLRTSKYQPGDPEVPYAAVVDADTYPNVLPLMPPLVDPSHVYHQVAAIAETPTSWNDFALIAKAGKITLTVDGAVLLFDVPIPGWTKGRSYTWGIFASTGNNIAGHRAAVRNVALASCP